MTTEIPKQPGSGPDDMPDFLMHGGGSNPELQPGMFGRQGVPAPSQREPQNTPHPYAYRKHPAPGVLGQIARDNEGIRSQPQ